MKGINGKSKCTRWKYRLVLGLIALAIMTSVLAASIEGLGRIIALWKYILG